MPEPAQQYYEYALAAEKDVAAFDKLVKEMLKAFDELGNDVFARVDARRCSKLFRRKAKKIGIK
jgi:hypothetical protein